VPQNAMKQKSTFFAFGAAHLGGNTGVIALLESKGYRLRPIFDKPVANPLAAQPQTLQRVLKASEYFEIGKKKEEEREFLEAIDNYSQAIVLNSQYVEAYKRRADLRLNNIRDTQGAMMDLNQAITIASKDTSLYYSRARLKQGKLKDFKGALADLSKIIEINPQASTAYFDRGMLKKQKLNDPQSALLDFNNHLLLEPQSVDGYVERGLLKYTQLADKDGGIADLRRAIYLARINAVKSSSYQSQQEVDKIQTILQTMGDKL
jgi:tetratricopeptide (TPR) repeat protein